MREWQVSAFIPIRSNPTFRLPYKPTAEKRKNKNQTNPYHLFLNINSFGPVINKLIFLIIDMSRSGLFPPSSLLQYIVGDGDDLAADIVRF
jgi:hypothetical protein